MRNILQKGIIPLVMAAIIALVLAAGAGTYYFMAKQAQVKIAAIKSFEECAEAGYPVLQTYPAQCKTPDGRTFAQKTENVPGENSQKTLYLPIGDALKRVTKKPFGIYVSTKKSPVMPERFTGYHTGTDFEILKGEKNIDVPVHAICGGNLLRKDQAKGYGGMAVQECLIDGNPVVITYGHLNLESISAKVEDYLSPGAVIGILGKGGTKETDFERKHLHLGIHKGAAIITSGYVATETELKNWLDPVSLFEKAKI